MLNKSTKLFINTIQENSKLINVTHSAASEANHGDPDEDRTSITETIVSSQVANNLSDNSILLNVDSNSNPNNDVLKSQTLPTLPKHVTITKSNMGRQYKLPTKVEVVNFSMAKKMMNTSFKESHTRKKIKNNHVNKSINPQLLIPSKGNMIVYCYYDNDHSIVSLIGRALDSTISTLPRNKLC